MLRYTFLIAMAGLTQSAVAAEVSECQIRVLRPVTDDMGVRWPTGKLLPATIMRRDARGTWFCAHGGSCVPRMTPSGQAARLTNCRIGGALGDGDFRLDPDPAAMGTAEANRLRKRASVENRLSALGFSNAASGSWANDYVANPTSSHGRLVARTLAGSRQALATMKAQRP